MTTCLALPDSLAEVVSSTPGPSKLMGDGDGSRCREAWAVVWGRAWVSFVGFLDLLLGFVGFLLLFFFWCFVVMI